MPAESLKSKLDGNQLDLSLSSLSVIPVKELAALPKATILDLSCNLLTCLPSDFCTLVHLVKLDLSKNQITELPENFGYLVKLQHLDLYQNKLRALPISFCRLNALKWLDIKDNELDDTGLVSAAGECLSDTQCRTCAKQVVIYMKKVQSDHERERQKRLKDERELAATRKAEEERELQRRRAEKKAEKEQRRQRMVKQVKESGDEMTENGDSTTEQVSEDVDSVANRKQKTRSGLSCLQMFLAIFLLLVAVLCGVYVYCSSQSDSEWCSTTMSYFQHSTDLITKCYNDIRNKLQIDSKQQ